MRRIEALEAIYPQLKDRIVVTNMGAVAVQNYNSLVGKTQSQPKANGGRQTHRVFKVEKVRAMPQRVKLDGYGPHVGDDEIGRAQSGRQKQRPRKTRPPTPQRRRTLRRARRLPRERWLPGRFR